MKGSDRDERLVEAETRLQILEALVLAASRRTEVLAVIGQAEEIEDAEAALRELLGLDEIPAKAILDTQLRRFTSRGREHLTSVRDELRLEIEGLR